MALKTKKGSDLPTGAVLLNKEEALDYQWNVIKKWPSESEVLFLKFGKHITSASTAFSSFYISNFFKNVLNINNSRFAFSVIPAILMPAAFSYFATDHFMTNSILLMTLKCPICDQIKFGAAQLYLSILFPAAYGYFSMATFAILTKSYPLPDIRKNGREFWKVSADIFRQGSTRFQAIGLAQSIIILFLPYMQNKQLFNIMNKSEQNEKLSSEFAVNF